VFDNKDEAAEDAEKQQKKGRRSACLVHIRRVFVDAIIENEPEAMWFVDEFGRMLAIEHYCATRGLTGDARLAERLKLGNTADIMKRIEERLETFSNGLCRVRSDVEESIEIRYWRVVGDEAGLGMWRR